MAALDKIAAGALSLTALVPNFLTNDLTTPVLGVGVTTVAGAVLGTYAAIGYDETQRPRGRLFTLAMSTVILASTSVGAVPRWMGWEWSSGGAEGALAGLAAVVIYYLLPPAIKRARELIGEFKLSDVLPFRKGAAAQTPPPAAPPSGEDPEK